MSNVMIRLLPVVLFAAAVVLTFVGVAYFTETAAHLPAFLPGHLAHSTARHATYGLVAVTLAILALAASWFTTPLDETS